jgi:hypothetical protein
MLVCKFKKIYINLKNYKPKFLHFILLFFFNPVTGAHTNMLTLENTLKSVNS